MTTGRINQVATSRLKAGRQDQKAQSVPARGSQVGVDIFRLRPCISFAIVLYHCSVPAPAPPRVETPWRGAAGKTGSAAPARWNSIPPRSSAEVCYRMRVTIEWMVAKQPLIHTTPKKSTGHPGSDSLALGV